MVCAGRKPRPNDQYRWSRGAVLADMRRRMLASLPTEVY